MPEAKNFNATVIKELFEAPTPKKAFNHIEVESDWVIQKKYFCLHEKMSFPLGHVRKKAKPERKK